MLENKGTEQQLGKTKLGGEVKIQEHEFGKARAEGGACLTKPSRVGNSRNGKNFYF